jgi:hypothetical protein
VVRAGEVRSSECAWQEKHAAESKRGKGGEGRHVGRAGKEGGVRSGCRMVVMKGLFVVKEGRRNRNVGKVLSLARKVRS